MNNSDGIVFQKVESYEEFPHWVDRETVVRFFHETMKPYEDKIEDIQRAMDYAFIPGKGQGGFLMLVHINEQIAGALLMLKTGMSGYVPENILLFVTVAPEMRGKGIGKQLCEHSFAEAEGDVKLHVEYDNPAKRLYERIGMTTKYAEMRYIK